jgi:hypothetical protein
VNNFEFEPWQGQMVFLFLKASQTGFEAHPAFYAMATAISFAEAKAAGASC